MFKEVNKVIMNENRSSYFNGNTVFESMPQEIPESSESRKLEQQKRQIIRNENNKKATHNLLAMVKIVLLCIAGLFIVYRYASIYSMEAKIASIGTQTENVNYESENIYLELLKFNNIDYIQNTAINKLHMSFPDKNSKEIVDLTKNNFNDEVKTEKKESVIQVIKDKLF